jgi:hypothetical protein
MYNLGFGDCFLLRFPAPDRPRKVLIDCGYHSSGPPPHKIADIVERIVADVKEDGEPRIDVVVATHRHRDHVYGFERKAWRDARVGEVWMPWTEHRTDPEAVRIRTRQAHKALRLLAAFREMRLRPGERRRLLELVENSAEWSNAKAMNTLHNGFAGSPLRRFLPESAGPEAMEPGLLPGVKVHVLGPSRAEDVIRDMDPPHDESFLRMGVGQPAGERPAPPFDARWVASATGPRFAGWLDGQLGGRRSRSRPGTGDQAFLRWWLGELGITSRQLRGVQAAAADDPLLAAVALDKAVNGTSLMLLFQVGQAHLLFPGDAQYGTWNAALEDPASRKLLERTTFLKVGHHGSHNATPRSFVEEVLPRRVLGMVPTRATRSYPEIPRLPLLAALKRRGAKLARADAGSVARPFRRVDDFAIETLVPTT